jgi:hypothetical protein
MLLDAKICKQTIVTTISFGKNDKPIMRQPKFRESLVDALDSIMLLILAVCAFLSIVSGMVFDRHTGWVEGVCILVTMILIIVITSFKDWIKDR